MKKNPLPTDTTLSHYRILSPLGAGAMGEVYLAEDARLGRKVALKVLPPEFTKDESRLRRFEQEAHAASALNHPNILTVFEIGRSDDMHFIATEFIEGVTLRQHMAAKPMMLGEALDVGVQVAGALVAAHAAGIVHRDIKPENIMRRTDGYVKILDFGLAKLTERHSATIDTQATMIPHVYTDPGTVMGTVMYMSPEQARGLEMDARTDIFSLGVVLYEMAAGRAPFAGATKSDVLVSILEKEPESLTRHSPKSPAELQRIVGKALAKDREERYQTVKDLLIDLKRLKQDVEFEARLERTSGGAAGQRSRGAEEATSPSYTRSPAPLLFSPSAPEAATRPISSAEYLISEIKRHKRGALLALAAFIIVGAGVAYWLSLWSGRTKLPASAPALRVTRLTSTGKATHAAISPDGKYVVYALDEGGQQSLWVTQVVAARNVQIVPPAEVEYRGITFSRDDNFIYYVRTDKENPSGALWQSPALGSNAHKLLVNISSPITLSPDGKRLAFLRGDPGHKDTALMVVNADGAEEKSLAARKAPDAFMLGGPAWSPDGKTIACAQYITGTYRNMVGVRVADGAEQPITSHRWAGGVDSTRIAWLSDNSGILATTSEQGGGQPQIWYLAWPGDEARSLTNDLNGYADITLTADSGTLSAVRFDRVVNLWIAPDGEASRARQITSGAEREDGWRGLAWTPDGKIVYRSLAGGHPNVWIIEADGAGNKQLSANAAQNIDPAVSPDGRYIVWARRMRNLNIWRMEIDGINPRQLGNSVGELTLQVSPDGKWVVYSGVGNESLWKIAIDGGDPLQVTQEHAAQPVFSPAGKLIACNCLDEASGQYKIAVIPFEGGPPTRVFDILGSYQRPLQWTPDGRAIAYIRTIHGVSNLWGQPLDGGPPKQLTDFKEQRIFNFAWSRDGKQLALSRGVVNSDVVLISGFK